MSDFALHWLEAKAARVRPAVAKRYEEILGRSVLPHLGELLVDAVTRDDIEHWVLMTERAKMSNGQPYARETLSSWWRVLTQFIRDAVAQFNLPTDPTSRVRPPKGAGGRRREGRTLTADELGRLLGAVKQYSPERYAEVYVLGYTGMRAGELFALEWKDLDEARGCIHIRRSVWRNHVSATKTDDPRDVALPASMVDVLREHRKRLMEEQHRGLSLGIVFPSDTGTYRTPSSLHKVLALAAEAAKIEVRVTPQVLRRTFNTLMVASGVDRIVLRSQMGHCSEAMTARYTGVAIEHKQAALTRLLQLTEVP